MDLPRTQDRPQGARLARCHMAGLHLTAQKHTGQSASRKLGWGAGDYLVPTSESRATPGHQISTTCRSGGKPGVYPRAPAPPAPPEPVGSARGGGRNVGTEPNTAGGPSTPAFRVLVPSAGPLQLRCASAPGRTRARACPHSGTDGKRPTPLSAPQPAPPDCLRAPEVRGVGGGGRGGREGRRGASASHSCPISARLGSLGTRRVGSRPLLADRLLWVSVRSAEEPPRERWSPPTSRDHPNRTTVCRFASASDPRPLSRPNRSSLAGPGPDTRSASESLCDPRQCPALSELLPSST